METVNYSNSRMSSDWKIYGIYEEGNDECIYIGRTSMSLENRWFYHSWEGNKKGGPLWRYMQEQGVEKFRIQLRVRHVRIGVIGKPISF